MQLHILEPHKTTPLTLQVVKQGGQRNKVPLTPTPHVGTFIRFLHVSRRVDVLSQAFLGGEFLMAKITLPVEAIV